MQESTFIKHILSWQNKMKSSLSLVISKYLLQCSCDDDIDALCFLCFDLCCHCNSFCLVFVSLSLATHVHSILLFILCLGRCSQTAMKPPLTRSSPKSSFLGKINKMEPPLHSHCTHTQKHTQNTTQHTRGQGLRSGLLIS